MLLALTHRAVTFDLRFRVWEGTVPGWRPQFVPYYLRWLHKLGLRCSNARSQEATP